MPGPKKSGSAPGHRCAAHRCVHSALLEPGREEARGRGGARARVRLVLGLRRAHHLGTAGRPSTASAPGASREVSDPLPWELSTERKKESV